MKIRDVLAEALAGRYDVGDEIGAGGMATVFVARDVRHNRRVALEGHATGEVGSPVELFRIPATASNWAGRMRNFDVTPDGNRLLATVPMAKAYVASVVVVLGWRAEVARRMGSRA
jgi:hypothetical protein